VAKTPRRCCRAILACCRPTAIRLSQTRRSEAHRRLGYARVLLGTLAQAVVHIAKSPPAPTTTEALQRIAEIYKIEGEIRGKGAEVRRAVRQQKTKPLTEALRARLETTLAQVVRRSLRLSVMRSTAGTG
jgi:Transposase IS66 family